MTSLRTTVSLYGVMLLLSACGATVSGVTTMPVPKTPDQILFETKTGLDVAILQADAYAQLPRCGPGVSPVCSTVPNAQRLYGLAKAAKEAVDAGKPVVAVVAASHDPTVSDQLKAQQVADAATAALNKLVGAIAVLPKKGEL